MLNTPPLRPSIIDGIGNGFTNWSCVDGSSKLVWAVTTWNIPVIIMKDEYNIFRLRKNNILITVSLMYKRTTGKLAG
jgi:hypothetical protein